VRADTVAIVLVAFVLTTVSCTTDERTVTSTNPVAVAPSPTPALPGPAPVPAPAPAPAPVPAPLPFAVVSITFTRTSLFAGEGTTGTIFLSRPAPAPGVVVTLASNDPGVVVSPQVLTVAQNQDRMTFTVTTSQSLVEDRRIAITGSMNDSSTSGTLQVWVKPRAQSFFTFISEPGEYIGQGTFVRLVTPDIRPTTGVTGVTIFIDYPLGWIALFYAPRGSQLTVGRYDNPPSSDFTNPSMSISGQGRGCSMTGWFEVREINTTPSGDLARFDATFEQRCSGSASTLRGEIKFVR
jgi:hypothetical protein